MVIKAFAQSSSAIAADWIATVHFWSQLAEEHALAEAPISVAPVNAARGSGMQVFDLSASTSFGVFRPIGFQIDSVNSN
jgi:hypothetical protein